MLLQQCGQTGPGKILHDDKGISFVIGPKVMNCDQMRTFQVHALNHAPALNIHIAQDVLERNVFAGIGHRVVNLAEPTTANRPFDGIPCEWAGPRSKRVSTTR